MTTLAAILDDPERRRRFLSAGTALVEAEVASKGGLSGLALKGGFKAIKKVRPDIVERALDTLLPSFAPALESDFAAGQAQGDVARWFADHAEQIAEALLGVTDARAARAQNPVLKRTYAGLRGQAHTHTAQAIPGVGRLLADFVD